MLIVHEILHCIDLIIIQEELYESWVIGWVKWHLQGSFVTHIRKFSHTLTAIIIIHPQTSCDTLIRVALGKILV